MVITQDSDWISVLTDVRIPHRTMTSSHIKNYQEDSALPKPEILCTRILDSHEVCENDGQYLKLAGVQYSELDFTQAL